MSPLRFSTSPTASGSGLVKDNVVGEKTVKIVVEFEPIINSSPWNSKVTSLGPNGILDGTGKNRLNEPFESTLSEVSNWPFM